MVVLLLVAASMFIALVFSYLYIWTVSPEVWPEATGQPPPLAHWPLASAGMFVSSSVTMLLSSRMLSKLQRYGDWPVRVGIALASVSLAAALLTDLQGHWDAGLRPAVSSYGALVYTVLAVEAQLVVAAVIMGLYTLARSAVGMLSATRRVTFDNTMLLWHYTVGQGLLGLLLVHGFPRIAG
jgi:cytochrome c oxidase subunit I+III